MGDYLDENGLSDVSWTRMNAKWNFIVSQCFAGLPETGPKVMEQRSLRDTGEEIMWPITEYRDTGL